MSMWRRITSPVRRGVERRVEGGVERGAGVIEYSALVCVSAVLLCALVVPLHDRITPWVRWGLCEVFTGFIAGKCENPSAVAKQKRREPNPCVVDSKTVTGGGEAYLPVGGGINGSFGMQKRSDGSLIVTMTLTGKIGLALGIDIDKNASWGAESDVKGAISLRLTFKNKKLFSKFKDEMHNKEVDEISKYLGRLAPDWMAEYILKTGKRLAPGVLIKVIYDAMIATINDMHIPNTVTVSTGVQNKQNISAGEANLSLSGSVATGHGKNSDGTSFRSYTVTIAGAEQLNLSPTSLFPEGFSVDIKPGLELTGTLTARVNYDKRGNAKDANVEMRLQADGTISDGVSGHEDIKIVGVGGAVSVTAKKGELVVVTKKLGLTSAEKSSLTEHRDDVDPVRFGYYEYDFVKAIMENRNGKYSVQVYSDTQMGGHANGNVSVLMVNVAQAGAGAGADHQHLQRAGTYDPDGGGWRTDSRCEKAA